MLNRLFSTRGDALPTTITNEAGGRAYALSAEHALAQYAVTGDRAQHVLRHLNAKGAVGDLVVYVSDNMSWADFARHPSAAMSTRGTAMAEEWGALPGAKPRGQAGAHRSAARRHHAGANPRRRAEHRWLLRRGLRPRDALRPRRDRRAGSGPPGGEDPAPVLERLKLVFPWSAEEAAGHACLRSEILAMSAANARGTTS